MTNQTKLKTVFDNIEDEIKNSVDYKNAFHVSFKADRNKDTSELRGKYFNNIDIDVSISDNIFILDSLDEVLNIIVDLDICYLVDRIALNSLASNYPILQNIHNVIYMDEITNGSDLKNIINNLKSNIIIAIGGGRTLDILKFISFRTNCKMIAIPTSLTTHVYASKKIHALPQIKECGHDLTIDGDEPHITLIDKRSLSKLEAHHKKLIYSGFGDIMAFINAQHDWLLAISKGENVYNEVANYFVGHIIEQLGFINIEDNFEIWVEKYVLIQVLLCNITHWAGSAPASGAEHLFAKCIEDEVSVLPLHGEVVALGVLIFSYIRGKDVGKVMFFLKRFHISNSFLELGVNKNAVINALFKSLAEGSRKSRYTILNELNISFEFFDQIINSMMDKKLLKE